MDLTSYGKMMLLVGTNLLALSIGFVIGAFHSDHTLGNVAIELVTLLVSLY
jgi:hypothetical protein